MNKSEILKNNHQEFLRFLKGHFPLYHLSNIFLRDVQYGIMKYFRETKGIQVKYPEAEKLAVELSQSLETQDIFRKLNHQSWVVNFPEFTKKAS